MPPPKKIKPPKVAGYRQGLDSLAELHARKDSALKPYGRALARCEKACENAHYSGDPQEVQNKIKLCKDGCRSAYRAAAEPIENAFKPAEDAVHKEMEKFQFDEVVILPKGETFKAIARKLYPGAHKSLTVEDKDGLVAALSMDWAVLTLRLFVESGNGSFFMGAPLKLVSMRSVTSKLKSKKYRMMAINIDMNTCNGASSNGLTQLLDLTKPLDDGRDGTYWAWNKFHFFQWMTVELPRGNLSLRQRKNALRAKLAFTEGYRVKGEPGPDEIAESGASKTKILLEWFSENLAQRSLPTRRTMQTEKDYQQIAEKQDIAVRGKAEAKTYEDNYNSVPIHPNLDHVRLRGIYDE